MVDDPDNVIVRMDRPDLAGLPERSIAAGYRLRDWHPDDAAGWLALWRAAEPFLVLDDALFTREFRNEHAEIAKRLLMVEDTAGRLVATCAAWYDDETRRPELARIHWLAVHPGHQGCGLSAGLLAAALRRQDALGHRACYLITSTGRSNALGLYLDAGFQPTPRNPEEHAAWLRAATRLRPAQAAILRGHLGA